MWMVNNCLNEVLLEIFSKANLNSLNSLTIPLIVLHIWAPWADLI